MRGLLITGALAAAVFVMLAVVAWRSEPAAARADITVAVLPFEEHTGAPEDERLASRLTDAVTYELARLKTVGVVSRTSARQYEGARRPLHEIAAALNANIIMEATVDTDAATTTVQARLVDGTTDRKMWVETFTGARGDAASLARQIAASVVEVLASRKPH